MNINAMIKSIIEDSIKTKEELLSNDFFVRKIEEIATSIFYCMSIGGKVYVCGNGGSAADSQHFVAELVGHFSRERNSFPAICLSSDAVLITALSNDYGFESVFSRQLYGMIKKDDILFVLSTSGQSKNVIKAVDVARSAGA